MSAVLELSPKPERRRATPLRVGDVWVLIGPATEVTITELWPRPTAQKPHAMGVRLSNGNIIAEATLRYSYKRKQEYLAWSEETTQRFQREWERHFGTPRTAKVIPFKRRSPPRR